LVTISGQYVTGIRRMRSKVYFYELINSFQQVSCELTKSLNVINSFQSVSCELPVMTTRMMTTRNNPTDVNRYVKKIIKNKKIKNILDYPEMTDQLPQRYIVLSLKS